MYALHWSQSQSSHMPFILGQRHFFNGQRILLLWLDNGMPHGLWLGFRSQAWGTSPNPPALQRGFFTGFICCKWSYVGSLLSLRSNSSHSKVAHILLSQRSPWTVQPHLGFALLRWASCHFGRPQTPEILKYWIHCLGHLRREQIKKWVTSTTYLLQPIGKIMRCNSCFLLF